LDRPAGFVELFGFAHRLLLAELVELAGAEFFEHADFAVGFG
jgi:hypothetical protein